MRLSRGIRLFPMFVAFAVLASCTTHGTPKDVSFAALREFHLPAKDPAKVDVWITNKPESRYEELGILTLKEWSTSPDEQIAIGLLRARAAELGGDAIILLDSRTGAAANSATKVTYAFTDFRAMMIKYVE